MRSNEGDLLSFTEISATLRWELGSKPLSLGTVSSPARRNPKKHRQHAAQMSLVSHSLREVDHNCFSFLNNDGVMGKCGLCPVPSLA